jgi:glycosyltransferase involved in cell wall biosynthesis
MHASPAHGRRPKPRDWISLPSEAPQPVMMRCEARGGDGTTHALASVNSNSCCSHSRDGMSTKPVRGADEPRAPGRQAGPVTSRPEPMRIALVAPPLLPVPPSGYAGTERVVAVLADELTRRGHVVTVFASGDSSVPCELVPTVERALWAGSGPLRSDTAFDDAEALFLARTADMVWRQHERFDVIHAHLEGHGFVLARHCPTPVVTTLHGRLDVPGMPELLGDFAEIPLVSVSDNQRRWFPDANWVATVHHGMPLDSMPFGEDVGTYLALVGRIAREKGVAEAVEVARSTGIPLKVAARLRLDTERQLFEDVLAPAIRDGVAEYLGELAAPDRDALYAGALATLMLGAWPEPFGLVAIESMAAGTPVVARRAGALPELVQHGADGYLVDDVQEAAFAVGLAAGLDRRAIRDHALRRFTPQHMVDAYERVYREVVGGPVARAVRIGRHGRPSAGEAGRPSVVGGRDLIRQNQRGRFLSAATAGARRGPDPSGAGGVSTRQAGESRWVGGGAGAAVGPAIEAAGGGATASSGAAAGGDATAGGGAAGTPDAAGAVRAPGAPR